jgi:poly(beta-D-mannuronate) lyase
MKNLLFTLSFIGILFSSCTQSNQKTISVKDYVELSNAISQAMPGDEIVLANGVWKDVQIKFMGVGTKEHPIILRAETPGKVFIEGESFLHLAGEYLIVNGLYFRNGFTPLTGIIRFKVGEDSVANNCSITSCVIENFNKPNRLQNDRWIEFYGRYNQLNACYITGKSNDGETIRVFQDGYENTSNYHQIVNNYFGPRPRKGGPRAETIRIGDSKTSMSSGFVNVSNNYFEACNGEVEIISDKTNFNTFKNNIFYKCEGSLVLRHGSFTTVDGNVFIGGDESDFYGGIRVVSTGHWIINNYFYKIKGEQFRSPLALMNGIPMSPLNRYKQVTDVVVAYNTWIDCKSPWHIGVGQNLESVDVLPKYEIRSAPPIRSIIANNIIYNHQVDTMSLVNHSSLEGIIFSNNVVDTKDGTDAENGAFKSEKIAMAQLNDWLYVPTNFQDSVLSNVYVGFEFDKIKTDVFGNSRVDRNSIGAISQTPTKEQYTIDKKKYGPDWYTFDKAFAAPNILEASSAEGQLADKIANALDGDIIELIDQVYTIEASLKIDKDITIRSKDVVDQAQIIFMGPKNASAFEMHPTSKLRLNNVKIKSNNELIAFAPLQENMRMSYNLFIDNCIIEDFSAVLHAYSASFADSIIITKSTIKDCTNGIVLAAEPAKGDYNAEIVSISQSQFINVQKDVINFYRGGYDESTIGGCLTVSESVFSDCGKQEKSGVLIKTRGIVNVRMVDNTFSNNSVKQIAVLWGEKNNHHANNTINNSGKMVVEQQQKLDVIY